MPSKPLVSVGLPTYNRAGILSRAIESVLGQEYSQIELIISDNASSDGTEALCRELSARDNRIKYFRQSKNVGITANFSEVLKQASGEFFMWLADDDWLDPSYVARCMEVLTAHPDYILVCGESKYYRGDRLEYSGELIDLLQPSGVERMLSYYQRVCQNGTIFGVMRRKQVNPDWLRNALGGDWLLLAAIAFRGKIQTITETAINRCPGGASLTMRDLTETLGVSNFHAGVPFLSIAIAACKDIAWRSDAYDSLDRAARLSLACRVFAVFYRKYFRPYWRAALYPYWTRPIFFAMSVRDKIRKKNVS